MLVCGIDIGSTNLKVGLSDQSGRLIHSEIVPTPRTEDEFGIATDPKTLLLHVEDMVLDAWQKAGRGQPIRAVSTTGVGEDGVLLDADMRPLDNVIPWFDRRAAADAQAIILESAKTAQPAIRMDATRAGAKWRWLYRFCPEILRDTHYWIALTDFPLVAWGADPFMSETLAARTGCYDPFARMWIDSLLSICHAPPVSETRVAGGIVGTMRSTRLIKAGAATAQTLLVAGGHDHPIAASAIQRLDPGARIDSLGTANVLYAETPSFVSGVSNPMMACSVPVQGGDGIACIGVFEFSDALNAAGSRQDVRDYLSTIPLGGQPDLSFPISGNKSASRSIRQVLEAASMTSRVIFDDFTASGIGDGQIYATGGWSRSNGLLQLRASILGQTILTAEEAELALVGTALIAAEAAGAQIDFKPLVRAVEPVAAWQSFYEASYSRFVELFTADGQDFRDDPANTAVPLETKG